MVGLAAAGLISGMVIHGFEDALTTLGILAFYMPMVADTGGNVGSQAATVVVRALAVGEISARDWWRVVLVAVPNSQVLPPLLVDAVDRSDRLPLWPFVALTTGVVGFSRGSTTIESPPARIAGGLDSSRMRWAIGLRCSADSIS